MKIRASLPIIVAALAMTACSNSDNINRNAQRERELKDRNSVAFKAGEAAHEIAKRDEKAAATAVRELDQGGPQSQGRLEREGKKRPGEGPPKQLSEYAALQKCRFRSRSCSLEPDGPGSQSL